MNVLTTRVSSVRGVDSSTGRGGQGSEKGVGKSLGLKTPSYLALFFWCISGTPTASGPNHLCCDDLTAACSWPRLLLARSFSSLQNANEIINDNSTLSIFQGCREEQTSSFMSNALKTAKLHRGLK